jgi:hypothetical protein
MIDFYKFLKYEYFIFIVFTDHYDKYINYSSKKFASDCCDSFCF